MSFDVLIVGGGLAGLSLACALRDTRLKVALVESQHVQVKAVLRHPRYHRERRSAKSGPYIEELGHYNPSVNPAVIKLNTDKVKEWMKKGAKRWDILKS